MIYYDADISRQQAAQVLKFGGKHSFLVRSRKGASDCMSAPFVTGLKLIFYRCKVYFKICYFSFKFRTKLIGKRNTLIVALTIKDHGEQVHHAKIHYHSAVDEYYLG